MPTPVDGVNAVTSDKFTTTTSTTSSSGASDAFGKMDFLKLLVAQLKYQTPDKPVDSNAFMTQTAQLSQVESLQTLVNLQRSNADWARTLGQAALVGKKVTGVAEDGKTITGVVTGLEIADGEAKFLIGTHTVALDGITKVETGS